MMMMVVMMMMMIMDHIYIYILKVHRHGNSKIRNPFAFRHGATSGLRRTCLNSVLPWFRKRPAVVVPSLTRLLLSQSQWSNTWKNASQIISISIWRFPEMGVQLNHFDRIFHYKPSICGTPPFMEPPIYPLVKQLNLMLETPQHWRYTDL